ncbi:MAG: adenosylcobinamide-phosphate synthase CbiB [Planctomycetota bacterium]|jgi:adenosylcobinamide-phosphate synthase|nr:adenosylcobinamide-phosphate synthase CbiB [Planctomycetota bacterium]
MRLEYQILAALGLDLLAGDPRWLPHPVRAIGWFAQWLEPMARRVHRSPRSAGITTAAAVLGVTGLISFGMWKLAGELHPFAGDAVSIYLIYAAVAARDLVRHSRHVYDALAKKDLPEARRRIAFLVGRDTDCLEESGVVRAAVESVAENTVDGVTAPVFFAFLFGPVGAMVYRAVNTLDSTFGYRNERYEQFGWASARLDDAINFVPARLTGATVCLAAALLHRRGREALRILTRDARNHTSPNAGRPEAAMAGALGVQLGGLNTYFGQPSEKPTIGDPTEALAKEHILQANRTMWATLFLFCGICSGLRFGIVLAWEMWRATV